MKIHEHRVKVVTAKAGRCPDHRNLLVSLDAARSTGCVVVIDPAAVRGSGSVADFIPPGKSAVSKDHPADSALVGMHQPDARRTRPAARLLQPERLL
jgi:hypothetical protein